MLGGGQLARMLVIEGARLGLEMHVMSSASDDPAAQVCRNWYSGELSDAARVAEFFKRVDFVTLESEFLDAEVIAEAEKLSKKAMTPALSIISLLSDRLTQKKWLVEAKLQTSHFRALGRGSLGRAELEDFFANSKSGVVVKKRRFGYDGFGTYILRTEQDLEAFLAEYGSSLDEFIAEEFIKFKRELAIQIAISRSGQVCEFPLVEWRARDSKCWWVKGPVTHPRIAKALPALRRALLKSKYVGVIAFEFFDTGRELLVNEVAPRVHNSGHYSIEALPMNQFSAHLCSIVGLNLPKKLMTAEGFAMLNLIGSRNGDSKNLDLAAVSKSSAHAKLHWYGKKELRPGRKMGHLTALAKSGEVALKTLLAIEKKIRL